jgi:hypothetical protein
MQVCVASALMLGAAWTLRWNRRGRQRDLAVLVDCTLECIDLSAALERRALEIKEFVEAISATPAVDPAALDAERRDIRLQLVRIKALAGALREVSRLADGVHAPRADLLARMRGELGVYAPRLDGIEAALHAQQVLLRHLEAISTTRELPARGRGRSATRPGERIDLQ